MSRYYDAVILGGGIIGILSGIALQKNGISAAVIEHGTSVLHNLSDRVFALSKGSQEILDGISVWSDMEKYASIDHILIYDDDSCNYLPYDNMLVDHVSMGYTIFASELSEILRKKIEFDVFSSVKYENFEIRDGFKEISLSDGQKLKTKLVICAEGKHSNFRSMSSVRTLQYHCGQSCITCNIEHAQHHNNVAVEHFFPSGPFAILPLYGGYQSSIVWTEKSKVANSLHGLAKEEFLTLLRRKCNHHIRDIVDINSKINIFEISIIYPVQQCGSRFLLIGDSSHSIHPVAGQGLNIGIRDVAETAKVLGKYHSLGVDIGQEFVLKEIENNRIVDNFSMTAITTGINRIFSSNSCLLKTLRRTAMSIVDMSPKLKKSLIKSAMGLNKTICGDY